MDLTDYTDGKREDGMDRRLEEKVPPVSCVSLFFLSVSSVQSVVLYSHA